MWRVLVEHPSIDRFADGGQLAAGEFRIAECDRTAVAADIARLEPGEIIVSDALCSGSQASHDAMMEIYRARYDRQIEIVSANALLEGWR